MHTIAEKDHKHISRRIDPDRRAGKTRVAKGAERK